MRKNFLIGGVLCTHQSGPSIASELPILAASKQQVPVEVVYVHECMQVCTHLWVGTRVSMSAQGLGVCAPLCKCVRACV